MKKIETTVTYKVSEGCLCNLRFEKHKGFPADQRCRFCTNLGKDGFVCVLHNMPLVVEEGCMIRKAQACMRNMAYKSQTVPNVDDTPKVNPKDVIKWALDEYNCVYNQLVSEGYPAALAMKVAKESVLK